MIIKVAWRNIWRSPLRSFIVLASIVLGIWAGVFIISFSYGLNNQRVAEAIYSNISHVQIHKAEFEQEERVVYNIADLNQVEQVLNNQPEVKAFTERIVFNGMVQSAAAARGVRVMGINPEGEKMVSTMFQKVTHGSWFEEDKRNPILIGEKLAEVMKVKMGNKLVLTFQDKENNIVSARFTIAGLYKSANSKLDELLVFTPKEELYPLIGGEMVHEIAIIANETSQADGLAEALKQKLPHLSVKSWKEVSPELGYADEVLAVSLLLVMAIIMLALMFGILNNMLMAILERRRELGMLQAVGMNKPRIFSMIVVETLFLGLIGGPIGMLFGYLTITYFQSVGIDLSIFGEGLESFGIATRIYPELNSSFYLSISTMVIGMALLAAIYPAIKALKLNPVEAIRAI